MRRALAFLLVTGALVGAPVKPAPGDIVPFQPDLKARNGAWWTRRAAQAQAESNFDPLAQSWVLNRQGVRVPCAFGFFQFTMPTWATWGDPGTSPLQPIPAIKANSRYMPWLLDRVKGDPDRAEAAYNAGLGNIQKADRLAVLLGLTAKDAWKQTLPRITGTANAKQTTDYIDHIHANHANIQRKVKP